MQTHHRRVRNLLVRLDTLLALIGLVLFPIASRCLTADEIVAKSALVVHRDWERVPAYDYCARAAAGNGTTTTAVLMLSGSPYYRLAARNGTALTPEQQTAEQTRYDIAIRDRSSENPEQHNQRIADYKNERLRNQQLLEEFTRAMQFELIGRATMLGRETYVVRGTPRPGYVPTSKQTKVLTGMVGTIWVDIDSFHWVKVEAQVTRSVAVVGFLATVRPGTRFELESVPLNSDIWMVAHFSMKTATKFLFLFRHTNLKDETYFNYQPSGGLSPTACANE